MLKASGSLAKDLEPYKRVLAILVRQTCVSFAVSNPYQSLAEPAGALLLRNGKVPQRSLEKLLQPHAPELTAVLWGCETLRAQQQALGDKHTAATIHQVQGVLANIKPGLQAAWYDQWSVDTPESCRITIPSGGPSAASVCLLQSSLATGSNQNVVMPGPGSGNHKPVASQQQQDMPQSPTCSMAASFLQHWLDSLGSLNTFG